MRDLISTTARVLAVVTLVAGAIAGCAQSPKTAVTEVAAADSATPLIADPQVNAVLMNSCFACHSDAGSAPWYATIAPSYWADRSGARKVLNLSEWQSLDAPRRVAETQAIAAAVRSGSMPPGDYTAFDRAARLTAEQKESVARWAAQSAPAAP